MKGGRGKIMTETTRSVYQFRLENGLNSCFTPAETWEIKLFSEIPFVSGEYGRFQAAANHLIEHTLVVPEEKLFTGGSTRLNILRFSLWPAQNTAEAKEGLNRLGQAMANPTLHNLDAERERVFEEWAGACNRIRHNPTEWGSMTKPATRDNLDPKDPDLTWKQALQFLNRQADWTQSFTEKELTDQMKFLLSAEHLTLQVSGPMAPPAFYRMLKQSRLAEVPRRHEGAAQIAYRDVPATTDYASVSTATTELNLHVPADRKELYHKAMRLATGELRRDKDIGLYWVRRQEKDDATTWSFTITKPKENLMKSVLWGYFLEKSMTNGADMEMRQAWSDIMLQSKGALRRTESLLPAYVRKNGGRG